MNNQDLSNPPHIDGELSQPIYFAKCASRGENSSGGGYVNAHVNAVKPTQTENYEEDYFTLWQKTHHGSIELGLDEKMTSMTGSYSEILENKKMEHSAPPVEDYSNVAAYLNNMQELCGKIENKRMSAYNTEAVTSASHLPTTSYPAVDESVAALIKEFSDKNTISQKSITCGDEPSGLSSAPPVDPTAIAALEDQARAIATSMDTLIESLTGTLHSISALTVECVETYRDAVCKTCDAVDSNIKSMYQLMAKCEELSKSMKPVYRLHDQIKEIKRLLDLFESAVYTGSN